MAASTATPTFDYAGFKLGEKKSIKDAETHYAQNLSKIQKYLPGCTVTVDWPAFQTALTDESDRKSAGSYIYDRFLGSVEYALKSLNDENLTADLVPAIHEINFTVDNSGQKDAYQVFSIKDKKFIIARRPDRMSYSLENREIEHFLTNNVVVEAKGDYTGFSLAAKQSLVGHEKDLKTALSSLHSQLPGVTFNFDWVSFRKCLKPDDVNSLGDFVYGRYVDGIARELVGMCTESADYKEALGDAVKSIHLFADESVSPRMICTLKDGQLKIAMNPAKLSYGYDSGILKAYLESAL